MSYEFLRAIADGDIGLDEASLKDYKSQYDHARKGGMGRVDSAQYAVVTALIKDGIKRDRELVQQSKQWKKHDKYQQKLEKKAAKRKKSLKESFDEYDPDMYDLRAISEGFDPDVVACFGGENCLLMEATAVQKQVRNIMRGQSIKNAARALKEAKKLAHTDPDGALVQCDIAIRNLKQARAEIAALPEDTYEAKHVDNACKALLVDLAGFCVGMTGACTMPLSFPIGLGIWATGMGVIFLSAYMGKKNNQEYRNNIRGKKVDHYDTTENSSKTAYHHDTSTKGNAINDIDDTIAVCEAVQKQLRAAIKSR